MTQRQFIRYLPAYAAQDGAGVKLSRIGMFDQPLTDPFLMLDEFASNNEHDYIAGFPAHPHRGMETLSYLLYGSLEHQDHLGHKGMIHSGGAQWMSAGRGIIHSEMPARELEKLQGFQLWINLPASEKMQAPKYRDVESNEIPELYLEGAKVRAIAGNFTVNEHEIQGALQDLAANAGYLDVQLEPGAAISIRAPEQQRVLIKLYDGLLDAIATPEKALLIFSEGDNLVVSSEQGAKFLLLAGTPINEKVVHYGPFVMNSYEEIEQAIADYNAGRFGQ